MREKERASYNLHPLYILSIIRLSRQVELNLGLLILYFLLATVHDLLKLRQLLPQLSVGPGYLHRSEVGFIEGLLQLWNTKGKVHHFKTSIQEEKLMIRPIFVFSSLWAF